MVKTCPSSVEGQDSIPGGEAKIPPASGPKEKAEHGTEAIL